MTNQSIEAAAWALSALTAAVLVGRVIDKADLGIKASIKVAVYSAIAYLLSALFMVAISPH